MNMDNLDYLFYLMTRNRNKSLPDLEQELKQMKRQRIQNAMIRGDQEEAKKLLDEGVMEELNVEKWNWLEKKEKEKNNQ